MAHSEVPGQNSDDRLARAMTAGFSATGLMLGIFVLAYASLQAATRALAPGAAEGFAGWAYNLVHNPLVNAAQSSFYLAMIGHLLVGLGFAFLYAYEVEPRLEGPGWRRGMVFSLLPWMLSLVVFFPLSGAGFLGLALGAGPLPILGNLILHLAYGVSLGVVYGKVGDVLVERLDDPVARARERVALQESNRGAAAGILVGLALGAVAGAIGASFGPLGGELLSLPPGWLFATTTLAGGALGGLVGSLAALPTSTSGPGHAH